MLENGKIRVAMSDKDLYLLPQMSNRHGLIAGATGTGKTVTMKLMAEGFSDMGVPVFFSDVKGDLTGMCVPGEDNEGMRKRIERFGLKDSFSYKAYPTRFWDIFGEAGHPVRVTISGMGPMLLSRLLNLTEVQEGVLNIVFKLADEHGLLLLDLKDLRAMLNFVGENRAEFSTMYGNVSTASIGAIQRALLAFEQEGGECMFGEPELDIKDFLRTDTDGRGYINILESTRLFQSPKCYGSFLLWMLTELYEKLPEVGDLDKPRMVFFFDEAHTLFTDSPKALVSKIEQIIKLIRSKGVGVFFVTQNPSDIPDAVLAQLSNRVQHALRAYTPAEQKAVRAAASAFRANDSFDSATKIMELGVGEALVSFLDEGGIPTVVEAAKILPPQSFMGAADSAVVERKIISDEFELKYRDTVDRESAYEILQRANEELAAAREAEQEELLRQKEQEAAEKAAAKEAAAAEKAAAKEAAALEKAQAKAAAEKSKRIERAANAAASTIATATARNLTSSLTGGKKTSASTIAKRAATNALSSAMRSSAKSVVRGLFGNIK